MDMKVIPNMENPAVRPIIPQVSPKGIIPVVMGRQSFTASFHTPALGFGNPPVKFTCFNCCNSFDYFIPYTILHAGVQSSNIQFYP
jgi:hypothetical protein